MLFTFVFHEDFFGCPLTVSFTYSALIFFKKTNYVSDYLMIYTFVFEVKLFGCPLIVSNSTWWRQSMDIQRSLHEIQRYISLDSQKRDFSFLKDINVIYVMVTVNGHPKKSSWNTKVCISWRLLWMSIDCHHHVDYIDFFQERKITFLTI
jgi:hypothetical protein